jgi:hypothetical protein
VGDVAGGGAASGDSADYLRPAAAQLGRSTQPDGYKELDLEYEYEVDPKKVPWQLTLSAGTAGTDATATLTTEGVGDACNCWVHAHVPRLALEAVGAHVQ